jgi:hypothetical protein
MLDDLQIRCIPWLGGFVEIMSLLDRTVWIYKMGMVTDIHCRLYTHSLLISPKEQENNNICHHPVMYSLTDQSADQASSNHHHYWPLNMVWNQDRSLLLLLNLSLARHHKCRKQSRRIYLLSKIPYLKQSMTANQFDL